MAAPIVARPSRHPWRAVAAPFALLLAALPGSSFAGDGAPSSVDIPGTPRLVRDEQVAISRCPLFFLEFAEHEKGRRYEFDGRVANAGPGEALSVKVVGLALGKDGHELGREEAGVSPWRLAPGVSGHFSMDFRSTHWNRLVADVDFDHSELRVTFGSCGEADEADPVDPGGRARSSYWREILAAKEEVRRLEDSLAVASRDRDDFEAREAALMMERRLTELRRTLEVELPAELARAGAPAEWLNVPIR